MSFNGKVIKAVLLDITGVLTESTSDGSRPIQGSVEAVQRIVDAGKSNVKIPRLLLILATITKEDSIQRAD